MVGINLQLIADIDLNLSYDIVCKRARKRMFLFVCLLPVITWVNTDYNLLLL